uniref:Uncharacterized protein n=1 Tax=Athene cunicularia TaxID=194338 RepID=A0A663LPI7_ATHCN
MKALPCQPPALTYILVGSNSEAKAAKGELPMPEPCSFPTCSVPSCEASTWEQSQRAGPGQCLWEKSMNLAPRYCQDPFLSTTPHLHACKLGADPTGMPTAQPSHLPDLCTLTLPSKSRPGSQQQRSHLGLLAPTPQISGRREGVTSQKQEAGVVQLLAQGFLGSRA